MVGPAVTISQKKKHFSCSGPPTFRLLLSTFTPLVSHGLCQALMLSGGVTCDVRAECPPPHPTPQCDLSPDPVP